MVERRAVAGIHPARNALKFGRAAVDELWLDRQRRDARLAELEQIAREAGIPVRRLERAELERAVPGANHQGVLVWTQAPAAHGEADLDRLLDAGSLTDAQAPGLLLALDAVTDPHNLGACLRAADGAGARALIVPRDNAVGLTPVAARVASGAAETVPLIQVTNLARTLEQLQARGFWIIGLAGEARQALFEADLRGPLVLVLGSEGKGLRRLTRARCDLLAHLPMRGQLASLNVAVAAGICLYEALRQRHFHPSSAARDA